MRILFVISIVCFLVLLWAVYAVIRHVRSTTPEVVDPAQTEKEAAAPSDHPSSLGHSA